MTSDEPVTIPGVVPLPGALRLPRGEGRAPAVVLVHGSGPGDRDLHIGAAQPFLDLADGLCGRGVVVLRYDKRTLVNPLAPVRTVADEITDDAAAALQVLARHPRVDPQRLFLLGLDQGGALAPRVAADGKAPKLAGLILISVAARSMTEQLRAAARAALGTEGEAARRALAAEEANIRRIESGRLKAGETVTLLGRATPASYWLDLRGYDAVRAVRATRAPVLLLFGAADELTTAQDRAQWQAALAGRSEGTMTVYPGLNHLLRPARDGEVLDLERPGPVAPQVITDLANWILKAR